MSTLDALLGTLDEVVDERVGVVRHLEIVPREAGDPDFFHVAAKACNTAAFAAQTNFANTGGASPDLTIAVAKAAQGFWDDCNVLPKGDEPVSPLAAPRLLLWRATRTVLENGLALLGVAAPERM